MVRTAGIEYPRYPGHERRRREGRRGGIRLQTRGSGRCVGDGAGFAEYVAVKARYCFPAGMCPWTRSWQSPWPARSTPSSWRISLSDDIVIIGAGFMGNLVQKLVALQGRHIIVADTRPDALERAGRLGATQLVDVRAGSLPEAVKAATGGQGADASFEVTGVQAALNLLGDVTRMSGKVVIVGFHQGAQPGDLPGVLELDGVPDLERPFPRPGYDLERHAHACGC